MPVVMGCGNGGVSARVPAAQMAGTRTSRPGRQLTCSAREQGFLAHHARHSTSGISNGVGSERSPAESGVGPAQGR